MVSGASITLDELPTNNNSGMSKDGEEKRVHAPTITIARERHRIPNQWPGMIIRAGLDKRTEIEGTVAV